MPVSLRIAAVLLLAILSLGATAHTAYAQPEPTGGAYLSGSIIADIKRFSGDVADPVFDGETIGGSIAIGVSVHPRWDLQLGVDVPRFTATSRQRSVTFQRSLFTLDSITENQTLSVAALTRFRGPARGRLQLGYLAGLSVVRLRRNSRTEGPSNIPSALIPRPDATVSYAAGPTLGVDARLAVSSRASIVPGLHATVFSTAETSGVVVRPRVSFRWVF